MNIFLQDPNEVRLPPEEVRLKAVQITPAKNSGRVRIQIELTPFQKRPNIEVNITGPSGKEASHASVLETILAKLEVTMHIREYQPEKEYRVETKVYYQNLPEPTNEPVELVLPEPVVVDQQVTVFLFPKPET
jgi:hypothetical protein